MILTRIYKRNPGYHDPESLETALRTEILELWIIENRLVRLTTKDVSEKLQIYLALNTKALFK